MLLRFSFIPRFRRGMKDLAMKNTGDSVDRKKRVCSGMRFAGENVRQPLPVR
jgi:hypothetical protein